MTNDDAGPLTRDDRMDFRMFRRNRFHVIKFVMTSYSQLNLTLNILAGFLRLAGRRLGVVRYSSDGRRFRFQRSFSGFNQRSLVPHRIHLPSWIGFRRYRRCRRGSIQSTFKCNFKLNVVKNCVNVYSTKDRCHFTFRSSRPVSSGAERLWASDFSSSTTSRWIRWVSSYWKRRTIIVSSRLKPTEKWPTITLVSSAPKNITWSR